VGIGIIRLLVPAILNWLGAPPGGAVVMTALGYILWGLVAVVVIVLFFDLIQCAFGAGAFPRLR
jgi:hypothetical protein